MEVSPWTRVLVWVGEAQSQATGVAPGCLWLQLGQGAEAGAGAAAQQQPWVKKGKPLASGSLFQGHQLHCF